MNSFIPKNVYPQRIGFTAYFLSFIPFAYLLYGKWLKLVTPRKSFSCLFPCCHYLPINSFIGTLFTMKNNPVNNAIYDELGEDWYTANDNPVALLRSEAKIKNPWVQKSIDEQLGAGPKRILDIGCGGGF